MNIPKFDQELNNMIATVIREMASDPINSEDWEKVRSGLIDALNAVKEIEINKKK
ncbi:MAG: hypothetical protein KBA87_04635 [Lachnospiraceae bacterium]|jgi:hypothetical protein|nr:hypothetical protein [Lachnospiraceae bacterium]